MADTKISALTEDATPDLLADFFATADTSATASKKVRASSILGQQSTETGASYTFALTDAFRTKIFDRATAQAITIPLNSSIAFPIGTRIRCFRKGVGLPTISPDGGVTLRLPTGITPNRPMSAMVKKSVDQTAADYTGGVLVAWTAEIHDTDAMHDNSSSNSRIIIPSGLGIVEAQAGCTIGVASLTADLFTSLQLAKTGSSLFDGTAHQKTEIGTTNPALTIVSGPLAVTGGTDYFEAFFSVETDNSITIQSDRSNMWVRATKINPVGTITYQYGFVTIEKIDTDEWIIEGPALG